MLAALGGIIDALGVFLNLTVSFFKGIVSLFSLIASSMTFLGVLFSSLPSVLLVFVTAGIAIVIVLHLLGR
mgnify:FL=1